METKNSFSNHLIDITELPKIQEIKYITVDSKYLRIMMFNRIFVFTLMVVAFLVIHYFTNEDFDFVWQFFSIWSGLFLVVLLYGYLKFKTLAFAVREKDIVFKRGVLVLKSTIIPFNRIQHVAINQGPLMRWMDLSNLKIFTAGGSTSDLSINGLSSEVAESIKIHITTAVSEEKTLTSEENISANVENREENEIDSSKQPIDAQDLSEDDLKENKDKNEHS